MLGDKIMKTEQEIRTKLKEVNIECKQANEVHIILFEGMVYWKERLKTLTKERNKLQKQLKKITGEPDFTL